MNGLRWSPRGMGIGVTGIVMSGDRILLVQRADLRCWTFPGGGLEAGETLAEGLRREVQEETGLIVEPERLSGVYIRNRWRRHLVFVFVCKQIGGAEQISDESMSVSWFNRSEIASMLADKNLAERFNDAMVNSNEAVVRFQNFTRPQLIWYWLKKDIGQFFGD